MFAVNPNQEQNSLTLAASRQHIDLSQESFANFRSAVLSVTNELRIDLGSAVFEMVRPLATSRYSEQRDSIAVSTNNPLPFSLTEDNLPEMPRTGVILSRPAEEQFSRAA